MPSLRGCTDAADRKKLHSSVATGANRFTFQNAYEAVAMLLTNDSVPKFLRSRVYKYGNAFTACYYFIFVVDTSL